MQNGQTSTAALRSSCRGGSGRNDRLRSEPTTGAVTCAGFSRPRALRSFGARLRGDIWPLRKLDGWPSGGRSEHATCDDNLAIALAQAGECLRRAGRTTRGQPVLFHCGFRPILTVSSRRMKPGGRPCFERISSQPSLEPTTLILTPLSSSATSAESSVGSLKTRVARTV